MPILMPRSVGINPELDDTLILSISLLVHATKNKSVDRIKKAICLIIPIPIEPTVCKIDSKHQFKIIFLNLIICQIASFNKLNAYV